jgi:GT2 family glycosyltransferase
VPVQDLGAHESLGLGRGDAVVCLPVYNGYDHLAQCLRSVLEHTAPEVPILVCDDASVDPSVSRFVHDVVTEGEWPHSVWYLRQPVNGGFVENVNAGFAAAAPADVVILNSDCIVTDGWLDALRAAVYSDSRIATATSLTNAGTIVSVPHRNHPLAALPQNLTADGVAAAIRDSSQHLFPDLPTCVGHCVWIRRDAIDLVGGFDTAFSPGYEEEVDFSQRCLVHGLRHVLADDTFVFHRHGGSFGAGEPIERLRWDHHLIVAARYPYYDSWVEEVRDDPFSPLARSVARASRAMRGPSVTIDGRCLTPFMTGTALATLELVSALDIYADVRLRLLVPDDLGRYAQMLLGGRPGIELLKLEDLDDAEPTDVAHRPYQVSSPRDPLMLRRLGHRVVLTQLDNIAYRNPAYFGSYKEWSRYRRLAVTALAASDQVVFISRHAARDASSLELVAPDRANVIMLGTEQSLRGLYPEPIKPAALTIPDLHPFLLCLGTNFLHKNRLFAIRLLETLSDQGLFEGSLVFAGPKVAAGSSAGEEAAYLATRRELGRRVFDLGAVEETEKLWLLEKTAAVVYPSTYEGFGLVPFEAAAMGAPALFGWHTSLADVLPEHLALIVAWDATETARKVAPVLTPGEARDRQVDGVRMAGARLTAARNARQHADVYARALGLPTPPAARVAHQSLELQVELEEAERLTEDLRTELGEVYDDPLSRGLAGRYAILPTELRRPVLAVASRPALRATATALYRGSYALRHGLRRSHGDN